MTMQEKINLVIRRELQKEPLEANTDWFGSLLISGLLSWQQLGWPQAKEFAQSWLAGHRESHAKIDDAEFSSRAQSCQSRLMRGYSLLFTTYVGYFGVSFACNALRALTGDYLARQVCRDAGDIILHRCARNNLGLVMHDDRERGFTIPDVAYFVIPPLFFAADSDNPQAAALKQQARIQLKGFVNLFLERDKKLVKTLYRDGRLGETYWIRASGWLLWTMAESLEYLDKSEPLYSEICSALALLAQGFADYQDASGGFHLLIDDAKMPLETTGTLMIAYGIHKAVRMGWLEHKYIAVAQRAWAYADTKLDDGGKLTGCYSGWALPAEEKKLDFDRPMDWMTGMLLSAGAEFEKGLE